jgi:hypothetical protein
MPAPILTVAETTTTNMSTEFKAIRDAACPEFMDPIAPSRAPATAAGPREPRLHTTSIATANVPATAAVAATAEIKGARPSVAAAAE